MFGLNRRLKLILPILGLLLCGSIPLHANSSEEAVADELAGAANLLMGEAAGGNPVVIVRGFEYHTRDDVRVKEMYRPDNEDIIRKGLRCLIQSSD